MRLHLRLEFNKCEKGPVLGLSFNSCYSTACTLLNSVLSDRHLCSLFRADDSLLDTLSEHLYLRVYTYFKLLKVTWFFGRGFR
jgi:hypothetical protein